MRLPALSAAVFLLATLTAACGADAVEPYKMPLDADAQAAPAAPRVKDERPGEGPLRPDLTALIEGPVSPSGIQAILGTGDLGVGLSRVGFVLTSPAGFVTEPGATVFSKYFATADSQGELKEVTQAIFQQWPYGNRGLFTTWLNLDVAGRWGIDVAVEGPDGSLQKVELSFDVLASPSAPAVGSAAVLSKNKTIADVETLDQLSTGSLQDPDLYQTTIADAVTSDLPTVVVFTSPAFCQNAVCGPQVDVLQELKNEYKGQGNFIHVDFYDNPVEIQGDLSRARLSPAVLEWNLPSIEWTFVIDSEGIVSDRFEAFATFMEVEAAFQREL